MTQGPEEESPDSSSALDMVAVFRSENHDGEMEAMQIHQVLEASGIQSIVVGPSVLPSLEFQVQVAEEDLAAAEKVLAEAEAAGPEAASEAEADGEKGN
jgi:hypothetical protein